MTAWLTGVAALRASRQAGALVTVTEVRGHAPREAGAKMVVSAASTWASIGGGNLEEEAVRRARAIIASGEAVPVSFSLSLSDRVALQHGVQCCGGEVTILLEPLPVVPSIAIFGIGHVGLELARILARHDLELHLIDSREHQLTESSLTPLADSVATVHRHLVPVIPELVLSELPQGTRVLVLTHDHAEDLAIVDAALRCNHLASIGLIGSSAKWTRFKAALAASGFGPDDIGRVETPIGIQGLITSKAPAAIALSVAAALLASPQGDESGTGRGFSTGRDSDVDA